MLTSAVAFGAGMAAYNLVQRNNLMSGRQRRKLQRRITKTLF
ncbi:YrzQ family protein [Bacillus sp. DTU_2020_1000418_1_SI_GHA_SEK_038]|nr:YrzQ family protein [Bacillus sp. DTU_2020_1000418_1_SI_GHA_SEK_038]WNS77630.1 YrzQ family protein [Bacillus sp. DTU_2020_1000418_1_SI_GHA_SEK_038]